MSAAIQLDIDPCERETIIYCRISSDREDGAGATLGVKRQENECRTFAGFLDLPPVARVYVDNDKSAAEGKYRPAWEDLLADIADDRVGTVIAWHFDRLTRNDRDLNRLLKLARDHGVKVKLKTSGDINVTTASGRMAARQQALLAVYEVEHGGERMVSKHLELATAGKPSGGRRRFGYNDDMTVRPDEMATIQELATRLLAGESLSSLAKLLDARGIPTIGAEYDARRVAAGLEPKHRTHRWHPNVVRGMLTSEHVIGSRVHHGAVTVENAWPAVLDLDTWQAVRRLLADPKRKTTTGNVRRHLLSGLIRCANCDAPCLNGYSGAKPGKARPRNYNCSDCGKRRDADFLDREVTETVIALLERIDVTGLIAEGDDADTLAVLRAEAADIEAELDGLADDIANKVMSKAMAARVGRKLEDRQASVAKALAAAEAEATDRRTRPVRVLEGITGSEARTLWAGLPLDRQRAVIGLLVDARMVPGDGKRGGRRPAPGPEAVLITRKALA